MDPLSPRSLLGEFKRQAGKRTGESLLRSCEPEIKELMRQIDLLLENKRMEWEKRTNDVRRQLERRENELHVARGQLERKTTEVDRLRFEMEELNGVHVEESRMYDGQLKALRGEVARLGRHHEKIKTKKDKKIKSSEREKEKLSSDLTSTQREMQHTRKAFEELHGRSLIWAKEREDLEQKMQKYQLEIESLLSQSSYLQECNETYKRDLERKRKLQENMEQTHNEYTTQMEARLKLTEQNAQTNEDSVARLKGALEETLAKLSQTGNECESLHVELARARDTLEKLNSENSDLYRQTNSQDLQQKGVHKLKAKYDEEIARLKETLQIKAQLIRGFEEAESRTSRSVSPTDAIEVKDELMQTQRTVKILNQKEKELIEELRHQHQIIESYKRQIKSLKKQLSAKESNADEQVDVRRQEMSQLRGRVFTLERENDDSGQTVQRLMEKLSSKRQALSDLLEKSQQIKKDLETTRKTHAKTIDELRLANSQLDVLRLENQRLRDVTSSENAEKETVARMEELDASIRNATVATLESQNQRLQSDVLTLQATVASLEQNCEVARRRSETAAEALRKAERAASEREEQKDRILSDRSRKDDQEKRSQDNVSPQNSTQDNDDGSLGTLSLQSSSGSASDGFEVNGLSSGDGCSTPDLQAFSPDAAEGGQSDDEFKDNELEEMLDAHIAEFKTGLEKTLAEHS